MKYLYHYCNNIKCFSILQGKTIRLYDIGKSNDYNELKLFYPKVFSCLWDNYCKNPFPLYFEGKRDADAFTELLEISKFILEEKFTTGDFSNLVMCFSEENDLLSQWRGYADDGKGCCIGFSHEQLHQYCLESEGVLRLEQIEYLTEEQIFSKLEKFTLECLDELKTLRQWIVDNMTLNDADSDSDTDGLLSYNFNGMIENFFVDSLKYKSISFKEEKEWRLFLSNCAYKNPEWICGSIFETNHGPNGFKETIDFMKNRIEFTITMNDLITYLPINFAEFTNNPIKQLWIGPKNKISLSDINLFLSQNEYKEMNIIYSKVSYR